MHQTWTKDKQTAFDDYAFSESPAFPLELAIAYIYSLDEIASVISDLHQQEAMAENDLLYLIYPKRNNLLSNMPIHRDSILPHLKVSDATGYVEGIDYKFNA
ncbi:hypothetical protein ABID29_002217 [Streptococcus rupicaprae]|uniref:Uncharacterized protein n=1 Tax=Streptococcus rupicaprae TaxID=759619 RepID=A0ABV2FKL0_9STRE